MDQRKMHIGMSIRGLGYHPAACVIQTSPPTAPSGSSTTPAAPRPPNAASAT
jgi:hypothetical protein